MKEFKKNYLNNNYEQNKYLLVIHLEKMKQKLDENALIPDEDESTLTNKKIDEMREFIYSCLGVDIPKEGIENLLKLFPYVKDVVADWGVMSSQDDISNMVTRFFLGVDCPTYGDKIEDISLFYQILNDQVVLFGYPQNGKFTHSS